jgi:uroporphyrinogen-III synthase
VRVLRVLVTRPEEASYRTAKRLETMGHRPIVLPLMRAEHHPDDVLEGLRHPHSAIAITSAEAARVLQSLGQKNYPYLNVPLFAVGEATALAARNAGFTAVEAAEGTASSMIALFGERLRQMTLHHPLLYVAGAPRTATFEAGLTELEIPFLTVQGYAMIAVPVDEAALSAALQAKPVDAVLLYSPATATRFFELPLTRRSWNVLQHTRILCLSENVAHAVPAPLQSVVIVADRPDEDSLFALL